MVSTAPVIVWFRRDLRLADNPALTEALQGGRAVIPLYILEEDSPRPFGGAQRWWLHHSLKALDRQLRAHDSRLILRRGRAAEILPRLAEESGALSVMWNRRVNPQENAIDAAVLGTLKTAKIHIETFDTATLFQPSNVVTKEGHPFRVFTPFWRHCLKLPEPSRPLPAPDRIPGLSGIASDRLDDWGLLPHGVNWANGLNAAWTPGEDAARARLVDFLDDGLTHYPTRCDSLPDHGTSRLSPYLAFGEISPRQVWNACRLARAEPADGFLRELGWREFFQHMSICNPDMTTTPQRPEYAHFPWEHNEEDWRRFIAGATGYPIVDAGMRALWETGWMHNRVRMIVASFLVKHLLIPWQKGEAWFWDTLVDTDPGQNAGNWQWVAGCGFDAAPYFRIFNPIIQGEKFDPLGHYVRRWVPEIANLPNAFVHKPWQASPLELKSAGITLGKTYPAPMIDHDFARRRALAAFELMRLKADQSSRPNALASTR